MKPFNPKPRQCKACPQTFVPVRPMQTVCSPRCAMKKVRQDKVEERAQVRTRKESIKTLPVLKAEAQTAFNEFIRLRDAGNPCICCGQPLGEGDIGGAYDCGHYRSVGSAPQHRYNELNAHAQRKQCNRWGAGRAVDYRIGLIARVGLEAVEALEVDNAVKKFTAEELREIRAHFKAKAKELKGRP